MDIKTLCVFGPKAASVITLDNLCLKKCRHSILIENQEACGFKTTGDRNQVYKLESNRHDNPLCLAGTAEISLAGIDSNFQSIL